MVWGPILSALEARVAIKTAADIAVALDSGSETESNESELCDRALLFAYLSLVQPNNGWGERSIALLNSAIERTSTTQTVSVALYGGIAGVGWVIEHISSLLLTTPSDSALSDDLDILSDVDQYLFDQLFVQGPSFHNYDLISGLVGIGIYWLERLPRHCAVEGLHQIVALLDQTAEQTDYGTTWFTPPPLIPRIQYAVARGGYYNFGVAHGIPGILGFLVRVSKINCDTHLAKRAKELLASGVRWISSQRGKCGAESLYSPWKTPDSYSGSTGLAWCYGDLGIAAILHQASCVMQDSQCSADALNLVARCIGRSDSSVVYDAGVCHGAFGIAHIFNRIFHKTGNDSFKSSALLWFRRGMLLRHNEAAFENFFSWIPAPSQVISDDMSHLAGAVGIALCLLSFSTAIEPTWDRRLLLSGYETPQ